MKKRAFTLVLLGIGFSVATYAQTPVQKTKSVVFEFSETWCPPCGAWGVDVADSLEAAMTKLDKGYIIGVKNTSIPVALNALGGDAMYTNFAVDGVPSFIINNASIDEGVTQNNTADVARMLSKISHFDSVEAVGGIAAALSVTGNTLTVTAKSKFWNATAGDYYMSVLLVEDDLSATQNSYPTNPAIHTNVLRGAMATSGTALAVNPWGESVGTSMIAAGQEFTKTYKVDMDASWNASKLAAYAILFKKNTDTIYEVVNADKAASVTTSVSDVSSLEEVSVYPNPATDMIHIQFSASKECVMDARITDVQGKVVYYRKNIAVSKGENNLQVKTGNLTGGNYLITLFNDKVSFITRDIIIK